MLQKLADKEKWVPSKPLEWPKYDPPIRFPALEPARDDSELQRLQKQNQDLQDRLKLLEQKLRKE